jgi:hypothetical protein
MLYMLSGLNAQNNLNFVQLLERFFEVDPPGVTNEPSFFSILHKKTHKKKSVVVFR